MPPYGYNGKLLHVDLTHAAAFVETPDDRWYRIYAGGGLMGAALLMRNTRKGMDAFDPEMMLAFVSGIIAGQDAPGLARFCVVTKSPLSGGIAEARGEGAFAVSLKASGFDAITITGQAERPVSLIIENGSARIEDAQALWGKSTLETARHYQAAYGIPLSATAAIGIAGEKLVRYASIVAGGANHAARFGTGAVMGAKRLKAVVVIGGTPPPVAHEEQLEQIRAYFMENMKANTLSMWQKAAPGFAASADLSDYDTAYIGTNNYQDDLRLGNSGFKRENYLPYYRGENACPGCPNDCMKYIGTDEADKDACCIHQEITGALGPNVGNKSLPIVLEGNRLCNLYGVDPVSLGFCISFWMECCENGLFRAEQCDGLDVRFGRDNSILPLIEKICRREGIGMLLGEGVKRAAQQIGPKAMRYAMHVKGVEMVSFEPRTQTNLAMGYVVAPVGPRYEVCEHDWDFDVISGWKHTMELSNAIGIYERIPMEELSLRKIKNFNALYTLWSACDALNLCIFASAPTRVLGLEKIASLIQAVTGYRTSSYEFMRYGQRRNTMLRLYNLREGLAAEDDMLPDRFFDEPVKFGRLRGARLDRVRFIACRTLFYGMCGWDAAGIPRESTLYDLDLVEFSPSARVKGE